MRQPLALLVPLLTLAACGGGDAGNAGEGNWKSDNGIATPESFTRADGSVDRVRYRLIATTSCARGMVAENSSIPRETVDRFCNCLADRLIANASDEELRATARNTPADDAVSLRIMNQATVQCGRPPLSPADIADQPGAPTTGTPDDEPPPPPEPAPLPPGQQTGTPPPVVQEPPPRR